MNYEIGFDTRQGALLVNFSGILTQNGLLRHYLEVTDLLESHRMQCSIINLLNVVSSPISSKAISTLSRNEPLYISGKPRVFVASGRESIDLWRSFISTNRNPTRTRLAGSISEALELLDLEPLSLTVKRSSREVAVDLAMVANSQCSSASVLEI
ncbi:MAG TPA: hypothetical protein VF786_14800 [Terriglobales bacterium]